MDVLTHFLIPYSAALFALGLHRPGRRDGLDTARRAHRQAIALLFGLGGLAPDLDGFIALLRHAPGLWWLQHRGLSHTLVGAPLFALAAPLAAHGLATWKPARFGRLRLRPSFVAAAMLGSLTHLLIDGFTYAGVPALWPFATGRVTYGPFHWLVPWFFPVTALILVLHAWRGRLRTMEVAWFGAVLVVLLIVLAGVRVHYRPDIDGAEVFARCAPTEWIVTWRTGDGWDAMIYHTGRPVPGTHEHFPHRIDPEASDAVARARATDTYKGYLMGRVGAEVVLTERDNETGAWNVTFTDVPARFEAMNRPRWTPAEPHEAWGYVRLLVHDERIETLHRGW